MIINLVVMGSLMLGGLYFIVWLLRKDVRAKIEEPKYRFQQNINDYENQHRNRIVQ